MGRVGKALRAQRLYVFLYIEKEDSIREGAWKVNSEYA
jgi:hypothetical protein